MPTFWTAGWSSDLEIFAPRLEKRSKKPEFRRALSRESHVLFSIRTPGSALCKIPSQFTRRDDKSTTRSSSALVRPFIPASNRLLRDEAEASSTISMLGTLPASSDNKQSVPSKHSSRSSCVSQEVVFGVSKVLGNQLRTEIDTKIKRKELQQLDAKLPAVLELEIQAS